MDFVDSRRKKLSGGFPVYDRNSDFRFGRAALN
jgi:hypothetical protein